MADRGGDGGRTCSFLVVAYGIQGHLNPARSLARRLAAIAGVTATLSVQVFSHRRMFPASSSSGDDAEIVSDGVISYLPFSDGQDDGSWPTGSDQERARRRAATVDSLSAVVRRLAAAGRPVSCVVCTLNVPAVVDLARAHGLPLAVYWIQPATALLAYYHYFHGHGEAIASHAADPAYEIALPGLRRPLRVRDLPSFIVDEGTGGGDELSRFIHQEFCRLFEQMDEDKKVIVLVNTFEVLEETALEGIWPYFDGGVFAVGASTIPLPGAGGEDGRIDLFDQDVDTGYMAWLDAQPARSVLYVSLGSFLSVSSAQLDEIAVGLARSKVRFMWVLRVDACSGRVQDLIRGSKGVVVPWCDQLKVLCHPCVGGFFTHCGLNSTVEALYAGVPMLTLPIAFDQPINSRLIVEEWKVGYSLKEKSRADGVIGSEDIAETVKRLMMDCGDGEADGVMRRRASLMREVARGAVEEGGSSHRDVTSSIDYISHFKQSPIVLN